MKFSTILILIISIIIIILFISRLPKSPLQPKNLSTKQPLNDNYQKLSNQTHPYFNNTLQLQAKDNLQIDSNWQISTTDYKNLLKQHNITDLDTTYAILKIIYQNKTSQNYTITLSQNTFTFNAQYSEDIYAQIGFYNQENNFISLVQSNTIKIG